MDISYIVDLSSSINKIYPKITNINEFMEKFNRNINELDLKKIDNELTEIKKILDINNISTKGLNQNKDTLLDSIDEKLDYLKNIAEDDAQK